MTEPTPESERKTNSISPNNNLNLFFYDKSPEKLESCQVSEYDPQSPQSYNAHLHKVEDSESDVKSHKKFRDLNKSLANLAMKRVTGRSASDNDALHSYFPEKFRAATDSKYRLNPDYYYHASTLKPNKTPIAASKLHYDIETPVSKNQEKLDLSADKTSEMAHFNPLDSPFDEHVNKEPSHLSSSNNTNPGNQVIPKRLFTNNQNQGTKTGQRAFHHHHHNTSLSRYQQQKNSNQNNQAHNHPMSNYRTVSSNFVITEVNSPYYHRHEMRDLSQYFNDNSISSIDSARNHHGSRFSGITDEFKGLDMHNGTSIPSKNNLSNNPHNHSKRGVIPSRKTSSHAQTKNSTINLRVQQQQALTTPTPKNKTTTPSFKANYSGQAHFIYDMHQLIARHTKGNLEHRLNSDQKLIEQSVEEEKTGGTEKKNNFVGSFQAKVEENCNSIEENPSELLDQRELSDGVEYRAGGVGVGNSTSSIKDKFKHDKSKEHLEQLLKQDALKVTIDYANIDLHFN